MSVYPACRDAIDSTVVFWRAHFQPVSAHISGYMRSLYSVRTHMAANGGVAGITGCILWIWKFDRSRPGEPASGTYGNLEAGVFMSDQKLFSGAEKMMPICSVSKLPFGILETAAFPNYFQVTWSLILSSNFLRLLYPISFAPFCRLMTGWALNYPTATKRTDFDLIDAGGQTI